MERFIPALIVALLLASAPAGAQQGQPSSAGDVQARGLPVSLDRIRLAVEQAPVERLRGLNEQPTFKIEVRERQKFQDLLSTLDFSAGPVPPGGRAYYDLQQVVTPKIYQPYAGFTQGEAAVILLENFLEKFLLPRLAENVAAGQQQRAEQSARDEVDRALAEFTASHPESAAGVAR